MYYQKINKKVISIACFIVIILGLIYPSLAQERNRKGKLILNLTGKEEYFNDSFEEWPLSTAWEFDVTDYKRSIVIDHTRPSNGKNCLKVVLDSGDLANGGERSEVKIFPNHGVGIIAYYSFDIFFPADFDTTGNPKGSRHMICQFHEQPIEGLSWGEFKNDSTRNRRPSVAVNYVTEFGKEYLIFFYGNHQLYPTIIQQKLIGKIEIDRNEWINVKLIVKWSMEDDGFIDVLVNGSEIFDLDGNQLVRSYGANLTNTTPVSLKLGLYRPKGQYRTNNYVFFDNFAMGLK